jgi:hypothetical protein
LSLTLEASNNDIFLKDAHAGLEDGEEVPETPSDPSFVDEFDNQFFKSFCVAEQFLRNGHMRDAFINTAVDETLARAMVWTISSGKNRWLLAAGEIEGPGHW